MVLLPILVAFADWLARALDLPANVCTCGQDLARRRVADAGAADGDPARLGDWLVQQAAHLRLAATVPASAPTSAMAAAAAPAPASAPAAHPSPAVERLDSFCGALRNVAVKFDVGYCESCASVLAQQHRASHAPAGGAPTAPRAAEGAPRCCAADGEHDHHEEEEDDDVDYGTWLCKRYTSFRAAARRTLADVRQTIALLAALPADATLHQRKDAVASYVHALKSCGSVFGAHCRLFLPKGRISKRLAASKHPVFYLAIARVANLEFDRWHRRKQDALPVRFSAVSGRARRRTAAGASGLTDAVSVRPPPASHLPRVPPPTHPPTRSWPPCTKSWPSWGRSSGERSWGRSGGRRAARRTLLQRYRRARTSSSNASRRPRPPKRSSVAGTRFWPPFEQRCQRRFAPAPGPDRSRVPGSHGRAAVRAGGGGLCAARQLRPWRGVPSVRSLLPVRSQRFTLQVPHDQIRSLLKGIDPVRRRRGAGPPPGRRWGSHPAHAPPPPLPTCRRARRTCPGNDARARVPADPTGSLVARGHRHTERLGRARVGATHHARPLRRLCS